MFNLIGLPSGFRQGRTWHLMFANRVIDMRLRRAINWYKKTNYYVPSNHILYRVLKHYGMPEDLPDSYVDTYINNGKAFLNGNALGFTSDRSMGRLHYGNFYGPNTTEIIIQVDEYWDWEFVKLHWDKLSPVKVLRHDQTHVSYNLMTPKNYVDKKGFAIIEIDINLLHMQHAAWLRYHRELKTVNPDHNIPNIGYFLGMCVLPNMLVSHFNQVIINKHCLLTNEDMSKTIDYVGTSFYMNPDSKELDSDIEDTFSRMRKGNYSIERITQNIQGIGGAMASEFMETRKVLLNRQNRWVYFLAISRFLKHCLETPNLRSAFINGHYMAKFRHALIPLKSSKSYQDIRIRELDEIYHDEIEWLFNV